MGLLLLVICVLGETTLVGTQGGSKGVDRGTQSRLQRKSSLGGKAWLPQRGFATLPPGGREEVCSLTFPPRFQ